MKKFILSRVFLASLLGMLALTSILTACKDDDNDKKPVSYTINGNANGSQVVPSVSGSGTGTIAGTFNPSTRVLTYTSTWNNLTGAPSGGGFYTGASGAAGSIAGSPWTFDSAATGTGTMTGTATLTADQAAALMGGNWYYSYGTVANPNGEIRGQITTTAVTN